MSFLELTIALIALAGIACTTFAILIGSSIAAHVAGTALAGIVVALLIAAVATEGKRSRRWPRR